jgi:thiosulfate/3-mercaptopyruvate sulfurtransferase
MALPNDTDEKLAQYAHPEKLVTTGWLAEHLQDPNLVVVESDEDILLYDTGHIPGAVRVDWHTELNDPVTRDYVDGEKFAELMRAKGIGRDSTVVFYGDKSNWWAAYALWVFSLFGHPDLRLLDGGRAKWMAEGRPMTTEETTRPSADYPVVTRDDSAIRAFRDQVIDHLGSPLVDVRSPDEFSGRHIPGARSMPWARAANEDGTFKSRSDLEAIYHGELGLAPTDDVVVYCRIGERSSHTWFALRHLLGFETVRNYDGSWTEWGNSVRVPIEREQALEAG